MTYSPAAAQREGGAGSIGGITAALAAARSDIPVRYPEPYQLHLNERAAAAIDLMRRPDLVADADKGRS